MKWNKNIATHYLLIEVEIKVVFAVESSSGPRPFSTRRGMWGKSNPPSIASSNADLLEQSKYLDI